MRMISRFVGLESVMSSIGSAAKKCGDRWYSTGLAGVPRSLPSLQPSIQSGPSAVPLPSPTMHPPEDAATPKDAKIKKLLRMRCPQLSHTSERPATSLPSELGRGQGHTHRRAPPRAYTSRRGPITARDLQLAARADVRDQG